MTKSLLGVPELLSIDVLKEAYKSGALSPEAVVRHIIERVEEDKGMNIWITPPEFETIRPYLDRLKLHKPEELPLWGIPFAIKDNIDLAGTPTTSACPDYQYIPRSSAPVVERLIAAGAIPLGKTNMDQFATGLVGTRSPYGETHNALKPELISGGSSSGSAVAVARGHVSFALGTDTAGSGRVPAALNGIIGYKPRLGAWPTRGVVPACASLDCVTVFTISEADVWQVDRIVRGFDVSDPWSANHSSPVRRLPERICLPKEPPSFFGPYAKVYRRAWEEAVKKVEQLPAEVVYIDTGLFEEASALLYDGPFVSERWSSLGPFVEAHPGSTLPVTETILRSGQEGKSDAVTLFRAMHRIRAIRREASRLLDRAVLVLPTVGGTWTREEVRDRPFETNGALGRYTNHCNLLDLSAIALPAGEAASDLPFGITFFALGEQESHVRGIAAEWFGQAAPDSHEPRPGYTYLAVCGLHMRGYPLEKQMLEHGAAFIRTARTAPVYRFYKLLTEPAKPGLVRQTGGGSSIEVEVWEMPKESFGSFVALIPAPLGIGKVELEDGMTVPGFVCESYAVEGAEDITSLGSWRELA